MDQPLPETTPSESKVPPKKPNGGKFLVIALISLISGLALGYVLFPKNNAANLSQNSGLKVESGEIALPPDAMQIQSCANNKGALYIKPADIPVGPVYMYNNGKVIGIEFMLSKEEFLSGKNYKYLSGLGIKVDHINIGFLSSGHEGYTSPHYHVDLYTVPKEEAEAITCDTRTSAPSAIPANTATSSARPTSASPMPKSATPSAR